jgi:Fic family protein
MWRVNWIHPFAGGNGRTSRAASYLVLCVRLGCKLIGTKTIPEQIVANRQPYYSALDVADAAWAEAEHVDVSEMETLLGDMLARQLSSVLVDAATESQHNP